MVLTFPLRAGTAVQGLHEQVWFVCPDSLHEESESSDSEDDIHTYNAEAARPIVKVQEP